MRIPFSKHSLISFFAGVVVTLGVGFIIQTTFFSDSILLSNVRDADLESKLIGEWMLEDLRTESSSDYKVAFHSNGVLETDPVFAERWFCNRGKIFIINRRIDGSMQDDGTETVFAVVPKFDEESKSVQISFPGHEPHIVLKRIGKKT